MTGRTMVTAIHVYGRSGDRRRAAARVLAVGAVLLWPPSSVAAGTTGAAPTQIAQEGYWVKAADGYIPKGALIGGTSQIRYYVCRVRYRKGVHPGNIREGDTACKISYAKREIRFRTYRVLVLRGSDLIWRNTGYGRVLPRALPGGRAGSGRIQYVCRAKFRGLYYPGKTRKDGHCKFGLNGRSYTSPRYQLLTWRY